MSDSFDSVIGQPKVRDFLRTIVASGRVSHAYLFCGPAGSNKSVAATAFAQALLCDAAGSSAQKGCGTCDTCRRIAAGKHPDVRVFNPEGANGYLISQVREIVSDTSLAPIQAHLKVYILNRVDLLGVQAANAFLKTLEEPPANVVMVLLARTLDSVLPTIVSRCQVVPFRVIPPTEAAAIVSSKTGADNRVASWALAACSGSLTGAVDFLRSNERLEFRREVFHVLAELPASDDWDLLCAAKRILERVKAPLDEVRATLESELAQNADFLEKSAIRQLEARNKRTLSAKSNEYLQQFISLVRSWLRDLMVVCAGTPQFVVNTDVMDVLTSHANRSDLAKITHALCAADDCEHAIFYNVSPETCIDALLIELRDRLFS